MVSCFSLVFVSTSNSGWIYLKDTNESEIGKTVGTGRVGGVRMNWEKDGSENCDPHTVQLMSPHLLGQ